MSTLYFFYFFFQAEDGIRDYRVTGIQTCALPIRSAGSRSEPQGPDNRVCRLIERNSTRLNSSLYIDNKTKGNKVVVVRMWICLSLVASDSKTNAPTCMTQNFLIPLSI